MPLITNNVKAVVFDYGNTLIRFAEEEWTAYGESLAQALSAIYGPLDMDEFWDIRRNSRLAPYAADNPEHRENDLGEITVTLVEALYGKTPTEPELKRVLEARYESFVNAVEVEPDVAGILSVLRERYAFALLSNYPDGAAIRGSLQKTGLAPFFGPVVVSGDVGYCKPHPILFAMVLEQLGLRAAEAVFVGDNWLADIQGAKRVGMQAIQIARWRSGDQVNPKPGDHQPDARIEHLSALPGLLL